jgi:hypothetical protein
MIICRPSGALYCDCCRPMAFAMGYNLVAAPRLDSGRDAIRASRHFCRTALTPRPLPHAGDVGARNALRVRAGEGDGCGGAVGAARLVGPGLLKQPSQLWSYGRG